MDVIFNQVSALKLFVNECLKNKEPWQIVSYTTSTVLAAVWLHGYIFQEESKYECFFGKQI